MEQFTPIAREARYIWALAGWSFVSLPVFLFGVVASVLFGSSAVMIAGTVAVMSGVLWWWLTGRRWRAWGYAEREKDLVIRRGLLVRRLTIVPYGRMQFIEVRQGPADRMLGTASVKLHTAAAATDAKIPLLKQSDADHLRERLVALGEAHAAGL